MSNGSPGCENGACEDAVCAVDPFCCNVTWDSICASEAATICEGSICSDIALAPGVWPMTVEGGRAFEAEPVSKDPNYRPKVEE